MARHTRTRHGGPTEHTGRTHCTTDTRRPA